MCLLILKPAGKTIPKSYLENASERNPHGCGIAYAKEGQITVEKSAKWSASEIQMILDEHSDHPAIIHFRYATHGSQNKDNTHPFVLNDSWVAAHNGIIPNMKTLHDESDTRAFLRQRVIPLLQSNVRLDDDAILKQLGKAMGNTNKMAFLCVDGSFGIANKKAGHWKDGVWYSNWTYEPDTRSTSVWVPQQYRQQTGFSYHEQAANADYFSQKHLPHTGKGCNAPDAEILPIYSSKTKNNLNELWHTIDLHTLSCDSCGQIIHGECKVEGMSGLLYGPCCYEKI